MCPNVLLQVLDDGRLTDGHGRTVDFTNAIIVMTSNLGSQAILEMTDAGALDMEIEAHTRELLKKALRPELLNRIDATITFHQLTREHLADIVEIQLAHLRTRLADRGLSLQVSPEATRALATEGYDPQFGARPLKRVIQQRLENPLAMQLLAGEFEGGDTIVVDYEGMSFTFTRRANTDAETRTCMTLLMSPGVWHGAQSPRRAQRPLRQPPTHLERDSSRVPSA